MYNLLLFIALSLINVVLSTVKSILTIKASNFVASLINAVSYAFNSIVIKQLVGFDTTTTIIVVVVTNFIGVWFGKWLLEKFRKDSLWKIEATVDDTQSGKLSCMLSLRDIPYTVSEVQRNTSKGKYYNFGIYSTTQDESSYIKFLLKETNAKYTVFESRGL